MNIQSKFKTYSVDFIENLHLFNDYIKDETTYFAIDQNILKLYKDIFSKIPKNRLYAIDAIEQKKNIDTVIDICEQMILI